MGRDPIEQVIISTILQKIRSIPQVLAAYEIDPSKTKDVNLLLEEMELHLLVAGKVHPKE